MLLKSFTLAATGLAVATQAFLIPPEITEADKNAIDSISVEEFQVVESHAVALDCPGCLVTLPHHPGGSKDHKHSHPSHLELNFMVSSRPDGDHLLVNGFELYPNADPSNGFPSAFVVPDKPKHDGGRKQLKSHHKMRPSVKPAPVPQALGFGLHVSPVAKAEDDMLELISLDLQIVEVGQRFVDGIPAVHVSLIKTPDAKLAIQTIETREPESIGAPKDGQEECTSMLCIWRAVADRVKGMRPHQHCGGHRHPHNHGVGPHREGGPHHHRGSHLFAKFFYRILAPVMIGATAGIGVTLIFLGVWGLTLALWRKVVRGQPFFPESRGCRLGRRAHKAAPEEAAVEDEKAGLVEHQDPPPSYEDEVNAEDKV